MLMNNKELKNITENNKKDTIQKPKYENLTKKRIDNIENELNALKIKIDYIAIALKNNEKQKPEQPDIKNENKN